MDRERKNAQPSGWRTAMSHVLRVVFGWTKIQKRPVFEEAIDSIADSMFQRLELELAQLDQQVTAATLRLYHTQSS